MSILSGPVDPGQIAMFRAYDLANTHTGGRVISSDVWQKPSTDETKYNEEACDAGKA